MRLANVVSPDTPGAALAFGFDGYVAVVTGAWVQQVGGASLSATMDELLGGGEAAWQRLEEAWVACCESSANTAGAGTANGVYSDADVTFAPPVVRPGKIIGAGRNYARDAAHKAQMRSDFGQEDGPVGFLKTSHSLTGNGTAIEIPSSANTVMFECELAVIIGRRADRIGPEAALEYVAGFTVANDVTAISYRFWDLTLRGYPPIGKNFRTFAPMGPYLVTRSSSPDAAAMHVWSRLNGKLRQDASTANMVFLVPELVSMWSEIGLEPGDVILTGTPPDIGMSNGAAVGGELLLTHGDVVECGVDGLGVLRNVATMQPE